MKKILITGANGFIGRALYNSLRSQYEVFGIGKSAADMPDYTMLDLTQQDEVGDYFKEYEFDIVIHLAAILANASNKNDLTPLFKNVEMQRNLIDSLSHFKTCQFINFSSSAVYPNISGLFSENDIIDPSVNNDALYGLAKFNGEMLFKILLPKHFSQLHLRVGYVYGKGMDSNRIHSMFKKELLNDNVITVFGNGIRTIPQIHLTSLIEKLSFFIEKNINGTFNIADENISLEGIAQNIIKKHGNEKSRIEYVEAGNRSQFGINITKLVGILK